MKRFIFKISKSINSSKKNTKGLDLFLKKISKKIYLKHTREWEIKKKKKEFF